MPSFGILCAAMFRFERERVLHCSLYCGTATAYPVSACSAGRWLHSGSRVLRNDGYRGRFLRNDGSTLGPLPLICPSQRILNSCSALIKFRRVQTSLRRIIIRSESCWLNIILAPLFFSFLCTSLSKISNTPLCHAYTLEHDRRTPYIPPSPKIQEQVTGPCRNIGT